MKKLVLLLFSILLLNSFYSVALPNPSHAYVFQNTATLEDKIGSINSNGSTITAKGQADPWGGTDAWDFEPGDFVSMPISLLHGASSNSGYCIVNFESINFAGSTDDPAIIYAESGTPIHQVRLMLDNYPMLYSGFYTTGGAAGGGVPIPTVTTGHYIGFGWSYDSVAQVRNSIINNTMDGYVVQSGTFDLTSGSFAFGKSVRVNTNQFDGQFAQCLFWDVALTQADVNELYNNATGAFYHYIPSYPPTKPSFSAPTPINYTRQSSVVVNCSHNATGINYYLWVNNSPYFYNASPTVSGGYFVWTSNFTNGNTYKYSCSVQNTSNGLFSENITHVVTIDSSEPAISYIYPVGGEFITNSTGFKANISIVDDYEVYTVNFTLFNSSGSNVLSIFYDDTNQSSFNFTNFINWTGFPDGRYTPMLRTYDTHSEPTFNLVPSKITDTKEQLVSDKGVMLMTAGSAGTDKELPKEILNNKISTVNNNGVLKTSLDYIADKDGSLPVFSHHYYGGISYQRDSKYLGHLIWGEFVTDYEKAREILVNDKPVKADVKVEVLNKTDVIVYIIPEVTLKMGDKVFIDPETYGLNKNEVNKTIYKDTTLPLLDNLSLSSSSITLGSSIVIYADSSDAIGNVTVYVNITDPNVVTTSYSMTFLSGDTYYKSYTPAILGVYNFTFYSIDSALWQNTNHSNLTLTVSAATVPVVPGGGGGGSSPTYLISGECNIVKIRPTSGNIYMLKDSSEQIIVKNMLGQKDTFYFSIVGSVDCDIQHKEAEINGNSSFVNSLTCKVDPQEEKSGKLIIQSSSCDTSLNIITSNSWVSQLLSKTDKKVIILAAVFVCLVVLAIIFIIAAAVS